MRRSAHDEGQAAAQLASPTLPDPLHFDVPRLRFVGPKVGQAQGADRMRGKRRWEPRGDLGAIGAGHLVLVVIKEESSLSHTLQKL